MNYSKALLPLGLVAALLSGCGNDDKKTPTKTNTTPVATASSFTAQANTTYTGKLTASDADGDKLSYTVVNAPTNGTLKVETDGSFSYMPNAEFTGNDKFSYSVSDGPSSTNAVDVTITVGLQEVSFNDYSRKAFKQMATDKPLPLNSVNITQDVTAANAYDDLLKP